MRRELTRKGIDMAKADGNQKTIVGQIHPDVLSFTVGKDPVLDLELAVWDCLGTAAHVTMLSKMRVTPPIMGTEERNRVVAALVEIIREVRDGTFSITETDQDVHLAVERRLTERLTERTIAPVPSGELSSTTRMSAWGTTWWIWGISKATFSASL